MAPPRLCCAPGALPADPGVDMRGAGCPGVCLGVSGLARWALAPWARPAGLGVAPGILLQRPAAAAAASAGSRAASPSPRQAGSPASSSCRGQRCCLMAQLQNSSNRIWPPPFLSRHQRSECQTPNRAMQAGAERVGIIRTCRSRGKRPPRP